MYKSLPGPTHFSIQGGTIKSIPVPIIPEIFKTSNS